MTRAQTAEASSTGLDAPNRMPIGAFEASLPRAAYVDEAFLDRERERDLVVRVGRRRAASSRSPSRATSWRSTSRASRSSSSATGAASISAHYDVCRHRGSRLTRRPARGPGPSIRRRRRRRRPVGNLVRQPAPGSVGPVQGRHPLPLPLVVLRARRPRPQRAVPRRVGRLRARGRSACTRSRSTPGAAGCSSTCRRSGSRPGYTLAAQLGEIPARIARYPLADLRTARRIVYDVRANWKVIVENYNECYHCSGVHPELCRIVPAFREKGGGNLDWDAGVPQAEGTFTFTLTGALGPRAVPGPRRRRAGPPQGRARRTRT